MNIGFVCQDGHTYIVVIIRTTIISIKMLTVNIIDVIIIKKKPKKSQETKTSSDHFGSVSFHHLHGLRLHFGLRSAFLPPPVQQHEH